MPRVETREMVEAAAMDNRNFIKIIIARETYMTLFYPGASISLVGPRLAKRFEQRLEETSAQVKGVTGSPVKVKGIQRYLTEYYLELTDYTPIRHHHRRCSPAMWKIMMQEMHRTGVIERSASDWCHAPIQRKSDGSHRFCIDLRDLNLRSKKNAYTERNSLPILHGAHYSSTQRSVLNLNKLWSYGKNAWLTALIAWSGYEQSTEGV